MRRSAFDAPGGETQDVPAAGRASSWGSTGPRVVFTRVQDRTDRNDFSLFDRRLGVTGRQQAMVAYFDEFFGRHVKQKPANEFVVGHGGPGPPLVAKVTWWLS